MAGGRRGRTVANWLINLIARGFVGSMLALPYRWRVPLAGWLMARVVGPLAGYSRRARASLALALPELPEPERRRLARASLDNAGRAVIESYSGAEFLAHLGGQVPIGPGMQALRDALAAGRPTLLVSGHIGNYDAFRGALANSGLRIGALYRPANNPWVNVHYVRAMSGIATPLFARGREGLGAMIRFLRGGGVLGVLFDQHPPSGVVLRFFGRPTLTTLSVAELALKYNALVVPIYALRRADGLHFDLVTEAPIAHAAPEAMMQALSDSLEARVRANPGQWLWAHKRWRLDAAETSAGTEAAAEAPPRRL
ncbi:lysophospholipid acyltransferase family protein [Phaeovulum sp.]|uniref:lysophospholipid acyltransferase family protein n=1 Tax=Phaeovulum sp. TaxID=2934796 RepID=UPI0027302CF1|nr:lysophospholipid acyltransferase family protein [Phaeovulum sp.]MDP1667662.1 lysophospholipid acyltransferase family protein [Phaeovulum sp.]MDZ4118447.1 lysophospholipid acyltransferase family protein [Phaeovulum sp.]